MSFPEYLRHDALGLAELVRTKAVHPRELVHEALARIARHDGRLGAVIHRMETRARAAAEQPVSGPLCGVPFLAKDLVSSWAGEPLGMGMRFMQGHRAAHDSEIVRRWRAAGVILVGKTNTPELGLLPITEPEALGPTRNPWSLTRTPGGSSGGSAAAVAAGFVPVAGGGDGGGSIRIPASCCGLFGLKPTRGRTPTGPDQGELWQGCAIEHVLTRSVRDSAALLDATAGPDPGAPYQVAPPPRPFLEEVGAPPGRLRVAFTTRALMPAQVDPECVRAVEDAARLLGELGHEVVEEHPRFDAEQLGLDFITLLVGETAAGVREVEALRGRAVRAGDLEPGTHALALLGRTVSAEALALALRRIRRLGRTLAGFFARHDLLLTPTLASPPVAIGTLMPRGAERTALRALVALGSGALLERLGTLRRIADRAWDFTPFTVPWNATGQPACSVPLAMSAAGLPIGVQLVARFGEEATLFRVSAQLETARPWKDRWPPGFAA